MTSAEYRHIFPAPGANGMGGRNSESQDDCYRQHPHSSHTSSSSKFSETFESSVIQVQARSDRFVKINLGDFSAGNQASRWFKTCRREKSHIRKVFLAIGSRSKPFAFRRAFSTFAAIGSQAPCLVVSPSLSAFEHPHENRIGCRLRGCLACSCC
jgi:hypothetical protein